MQAVKVENTFNARASEVWSAITDKKKMKEWYFDVDDFSLENGFTFRFEGTGRDGTKFLHLCAITDIVPQQRLSYTWKYEGLPGLSEVIFDIQKTGEDGSTLKLTHKGLESFAGNGPDFQKSSFEEGWNYIINTSLKNFLEKRGS